MNRRSRRHRERHDTVRLDAVQPPTASEFAAALEHNEAVMPEHAAMAATCDQVGIGEMAGYDLLIAHGQSA